MAKEKWDQRLYNAYITSGQTGIQDADNFLPSASKVNYIRSMFTAYLPKKDKDITIVDLACGNGSFLYVLKSMGFSDIRGVDISPEQVEVARRMGLNEVEEGDLIPFLESMKHQVDVILLMDILEHLEEAYVFDVLDSCLEKLKPGGRLIIHVPNGEGIFGMRVRYGDFSHTNAFTKKSISQICNTIGFQQVNCFEDKPTSIGLKGTFRRFAWELSTAYFRFLHWIETGSSHVILSANLTAVVIK